MEGNYTVTIEDFAHSHFIKHFQKKYKVKWDITLRAILAGLERIDNLLNTDRAEIITNNQGVLIIKTKFKIAGTHESAKSSGNRCIVMSNLEQKSVRVLLIYHKGDISGGQGETAWWQSLIQKHYSVLS